MTTSTYLRASGLALLATTLFAQTPEKIVAEKAAVFQYFTSDTTPFRVDMLQTRSVNGKPFSATEERHTLQMLGDGTRIEKTETDHYYRDNDGRTRIERDNGASVVISDPVKGFSAELDNNKKAARKTIVRMRTNGPVTAGAAAMKAKIEAEGMLPPPPPPPGAGAQLMIHGEAVGHGEMGGVVTATAVGSSIAGPGNTVHTLPMLYSQAGTLVASTEPGKGATAEDLGTQVINGTPAQGTRTTTVIPAGQIGNDREIRIVSERWFSSDLQMLVKSTNNDPRFGENSYALTNILQGAQDPSLFEIPADFNINGGLK